MNPASVVKSTDRTPLASSSLRDAMACFATGVIVLSVGGEDIHGMTANAFTSVSLDPPTVLCCVARDAVMHKALTSQRRFGISVLEAGQEQLARYFADKRRPLGPEQFDGLDWDLGEFSQAPLLHGALAWLECELTTSHDSGDHTLFLGRVADAKTRTGGSGLLFFGSAFLETGTRGGERTGEPGHA
ncbi:flavin reductase family protein [Streptomyces achromogenes]|uniref:flavin reductase family protein n=1 Tax=Streptomyces achromogenes TaxID=67255 RepID=UPI003448D717